MNSTIIGVVHIPPANSSAKYVEQDVTRQAERDVGRDVGLEVVDVPGEPSSEVDGERASWARYHRQSLGGMIQFADGAELAAMMLALKPMTGCRSLEGRRLGGSWCGGRTDHHMLCLLLDGDGRRAVCLFPRVVTWRRMPSRYHKTLQHFTSDGWLCSLGHAFRPAQEG